MLLASELKASFNKERNSFLFLAAISNLVISFIITSCCWRPRTSATFDKAANAREVMSCTLWSKHVEKRARFIACALAALMSFCALKRNKKGLAEYPVTNRLVMRVMYRVEIAKKIIPTKLLL